MMTEEEFLRQVTTAPELKKGYVVGNCPDGISAKCETTDGRLLRCVSETATMRWFVNVDEGDGSVGRKGVGKTLREAIKDLNRKLLSGRRILHPAQVEFSEASSDLEVLQRLESIANACCGPHYSEAPESSAEYKAGLRAEELDGAVRAVLQAIQIAMREQMALYPDIAGALEAIVDGDTAKAYRLLFGEDLP